MSDQATAVAAALETLKAATARHEEAAQNERTARSVAASALNALNEAQRAFDAAVEAQRKAASPYGSDWHNRRAPRGEQA